MIYILKLSQPLGSERHKAQYYVGYCEEGRLAERLKEHRCDRGAKMLAAANRKNIVYSPIIIINNGTRKLERWIKNQKNTRKFIERFMKGVYSVYR